MFRSEKDGIANSTNKIKSLVDNQVNSRDMQISNSPSSSSASLMSVASGSNSPQQSSPSSSEPMATQANSVASTPILPVRRSSSSRTLSMKISNNVNPRHSSSRPNSAKHKKTQNISDASKSIITDEKISYPEINSSNLSRSTDGYNSSNSQSNDALTKSFSEGNIKITSNDDILIKSNSDGKVKRKSRKHKHIKENSIDIVSNYVIDSKETKKSNEISNSVNNNSLDFEKQKIETDDTINKSLSADSISHKSNRKYFVKSESFDSVGLKTKTDKLSDIHKIRSNKSQSNLVVSSHKTSNKFSGSKVKAYSTSLGEGGFGEVIKGKYYVKKDVETKVAIKRPIIDLTKSNEKIIKQVQKKNANIEYEYKIYKQIRALQNKNIEGSEYLVKAYGRYYKKLSGHEELSTARLVMEYAECGTLYALIFSNKKLSLADSYEMTRHIFFGLNCMHTAKIIHNDLKPLNILLFKNTNNPQYKFVAKIADFGTANIDKSQTTYSEGYVGPESIADGSSYTKEHDIFSISIVIWELLNRKKCKDSRDIFKIYAGLRPPIYASIPLKLGHILKSCWKQLPEDRITSSEAKIELSTDLKNISDNLRDKSRLRENINFSILSDEEYKARQFYKYCEGIVNNLITQYNYTILSGNNEMFANDAASHEKLKKHLDNTDVIIYCSPSIEQKNKCEMLRNEDNCVALDFNSMNILPADCVRIVDYLTESDIKDSLFAKLKNSIHNEVFYKTTLINPKNIYENKPDFNKTKVGEKEYIYKIIFFNRFSIFNACPDNVLNKINHYLYSSSIRFFKASPKPIVNYLPPISEEIQEIKLGKRSG